MCLEAEGRRELVSTVLKQSWATYYDHVARDQGLGISAWVGFYRVLENDYHEFATLECSRTLGALARLWRVLGGGVAE